MKRRELGGVTPNPTITNRRNGFVTHFGGRWAFDGEYVAQVIAASGCSSSDIAGLVFCLEALAENDCREWTVDDLLEISSLFREDEPREVKEARRRRFKTSYEANKRGIRVISNENDRGST